MTHNGTTAAAEKIWIGLVEGADGGSFTTDGEALPTTGFLVGGVHNSLINPRTYEEVHAYVSRVSSATNVVGFWRDDYTGHYHIDGSTWHVNLSHAFGVALRRAELAIWDVTRGRALDVVR